MSNAAPKPEVVFADELDAKRELAVLGLTKEIILGVGEAAATAKADTMSVEPLNAPGINAYNKGVAATRMALLPLGWTMSHKGGVEATVNHELGIQLIYQNVDMACTDRDPQAISEKGSGARKLVYEGQLQQELFKRVEGQLKQIPGAALRVWLICVSTAGKKLRVEVSCPQLFEGNQFEGFMKRIFVVDQDLDPSPQTRAAADDDGGGNAADHEVKIARK